MTSTKVLDYFASLVADENGIPLTETALSIAQDAYPDLDLQGELAALDVLALRLKRRIAEGTPAIQRLRLLNHFFYRDLGFGANANDYYDPDNSYLNVVLRQRRGIPISLAVLHMELGQQIGLPLKGVSFPNHFLLRMTIPAGEVILDPLTGETLSKEQLQEMLDPYLEREGISDASQVPLGLFLRAASHREIIARMLRNLKAIYLQESRWQRLLAVQNRLVILLPGSIEEVRDRGLAYANLECFRPALADLEAYVQARPDAADIGQIRERMPALRMMSRSLS
ncbi:MULTISPECIES: SirB1 family protein [Cupriavidus]|uniref:Transglutaminase n=3 Tax=Cupriavidus TaxID=106589 RepID=A0A375CWX8_9BURK|nr:MULTISPECIES: SirB1 family protein [Cupriavidus]AMR79705.1 transglutaminase [Cupriavidus nantongensis]MCO4861390.1 SirB1 family protein [Cupriavidus sp. WGlv3]MCO4888933.1 SirB1 family protein [Cupriavidus sp. WGtm5]MEC3764622.1 SirB1 family protein [Cupriavidus sp. SS-3]PZX29223.1 regulator of sirC expression with transglutaminase-like and TPR domain [Cupriavidus alkaliphilus]